MAPRIANGLAVADCLLAAGDHLLEFSPIPVLKLGHSVGIGQHRHVASFLPGCPCFEIGHAGFFHETQVPVDVDQVRLGETYLLGQV